MQAVVDWFKGLLEWVVMAGQLTSIASHQADGNLRVAEKQADVAVEKERIKGKNIAAKDDAQMQRKWDLVPSFRMGG